MRGRDSARSVKAPAIGSSVAGVRGGTAARCNHLWQPFAHLGKMFRGCGRGDPRHTEGRRPGRGAMVMVKYQFALLLAAYAGSFGYLYLRCNDHLSFAKYLSN